MEPEEENALCVAEPAIESLLTVNNKVYGRTVPVAAGRKARVIGPAVNGDWKGCGNEAD